MNVYVSPTLMGSVKKCPRCLYDPLALKSKAPRGISATLPNGMDLVIKEYFDSYRGSLPPEMESLKPLVLHPDQKLIDGMRQWNGLKATHTVEIEKKGRTITHQLTMQGGIDDLLLDPLKEEIVIPDIKTKATPPPSEYGKQYYQETMEAYAWLLRKLGYKVRREAYLIYWHPISVKPLAQFQFGTTLLKMELEPDNTEKLLDYIGGVLPTSHAQALIKRPQPSPDCEMCTFVTDRFEIWQEQKEQMEELNGKS